MSWRGILDPTFRSFVVSYPKTGRTWLRMMLGRYLCEKLGVGLERVNKTRRLLLAAGMPADFTHDDAATNDAIHYRDLNPDKSAFHDRSVLLLGRDVRDTLVSAYFHTTRRMNLFKGSLREFVRDEHHGALKLLTFYRHWYEARAVPRAFLFMRYEEMHRDPAQTLAAALRFLGATSVDPAALSVAVQFSAFDNLRQAEAEDRYPDGTMSPADPADPESYKFRRGKAGGFVDYLEPADVAYIDALNGVHGCEFTR